MTSPYYVSPDQIMQDKAEYAMKGISKGRSIIAMSYKEGILMVADNPSSLNKISEIYDSIAFSGAGKYSEFENLRKVGIRHADLKGYLYSREDVTAKSLANTYSQSLGTIFSQDVKPFEVEISVLSVGSQGNENEIYRISFDGSITDEADFTVIGGKADAIIAHLKDRYKATPSLQKALRLSVEALETTDSQNKLAADSLEVAVLDRNRVGRRFRRLSKNEVQAMLSPTS